jgi:hypothetical protein
MVHYAVLETDENSLGEYIKNTHQGNTRNKYAGFGLTKQ